MPAFADDADDFIFGVSAYQNNDFGVAVARLRPLVGDRQPHLRASLVEPARRYYASALALTGQEEEAVEVLHWLLRDNPDAQLNARDFPPRVTLLLQQTRDAMSAELATIRAQRAAAQRAHDNQLAAQRRAFVVATTREPVVVRIPRWLMFVPLGVGQYANGQGGLGALFTSLELAGLAAGIVGALGFETVPPPTIAGTLGREGDSCNVTPCLSWEIMSWTGYGVLALASITGVIQANAAWRAEHIETRARTPPPELRDIHLTFAPAPVGHGVLGAVSLRF